MQNAAHDLYEEVADQSKTRSHVSSGFTVDDVGVGKPKQVILKQQPSLNSRSPAPDLVRMIGFNFY